ncbi:MAG TPA: UvrD-helicase domain-containing protein [Nocardioidaceae bacterium]|nr:UvrD-helicase domain-containing protein [Nocardioidaceae bacterium]
MSPREFSIRDPLPTGTTLLEASAGTGKTWTIGALVTRYVAEDLAGLDQMLVVTFGRAASQELRERVRAQLVAAERALTDPDAPRAPNEVVDLLLEADAGERARRRQRLREALGTFDAATIATTHQFCQMVLRSLGVAGDTDANATLVEDLDDLLVEVVDDLYLREFGESAQPPLSRADALRLARAAVGDPQARLEPRETPADQLPGVRVGFAREVRAELDRRKRRLGVLGYDDLLSQLAQALRSDTAPARQRMRQRWKVVLVDEFQDTDPVQWQVLDRAFTGHATMVLIGDPKQAIYAFRGGDVTTYLQAAQTATTRKTLGTNWRSDAVLSDSLQVLLRGAALGDPEILVRDVHAQHRDTRLAGAGAPFRLRVVRKELLGARAAAKLGVDRIRSHVVEDVARDIASLLTSGATFEGRHLQPRDVAVLAHKNSDLQAVQQALAGIGVPAVVAGSGSVFATPAATEWLRLLEALEQPHRSSRVRSAALTCFFGCSPADLDVAKPDSDALTDRVAETVRDWAELFAARGVAAVLEAATVRDLSARVLSTAGGERLLTDVRHVAQALHQVALEERLGLVSLLGWLRSQMAEEKVEVAADRTRRLDSDAAAVQLVTIHGSKGLEYPVVYLPTLWDRFLRKPGVPLFHSPEHGDRGRRCIDVGGGGQGWEENLRRAQAEDAGESLRLLYVAMTRAQSQVVAWWAPAARNTPCSPLQRLLFGRRPGTAEVPDEWDLYPEDKIPEILDVWRNEGGPAWEPSSWHDLPSSPLSVEQGELSVRRFHRVVDTGWRRTSYSSLSAGAHGTGADGSSGQAVGSEPEEQPKQDEQELPPALEAESVATPGQMLASPMAHLPTGARFGSLVHAVLETADPTAADLHAELAARTREQLVRWPVAGFEAEQLADALVLVYASPLGPLAGGATLRDVPRTDRLCEMEFELPLSGGDVRGYPASPVTLGELAPLLRTHLAPGDPLLPYADALADPRLGGQQLRGYLTGSVDVVLRVDGRGGGGRGSSPRYLVVDYKTNWLGGGLPEDGALTSHDYRPEALHAAMGHSDYPLQALLYAVVLHRFLRWRQPGYQPATHLGGVLYLYLRGMCGAQTPVIDGEPCGVFSWRPPVPLVEALSDLLDGVAPGQVA